MKEIKLKIDGIHCDNCRNRIINALSYSFENEIDDMKIKDNLLKISYSKELDKKKIVDTINDLGFETKEDYFIK